MDPCYPDVADLLLSAESVAIGAHVNPDGDAIGSMLGLTLLLGAAGVDAVPLMPVGTPPPSTYSFLPAFDQIEDADAIAPRRVFVSVDTASMDRLGALDKIARDAETHIVIDHHADNVGFGSVNLLDTSVASTGQIVWRLARHLGVEPTSGVALCCWVALVTDTGRFSFGNTTAEALREAASMLDHGVDVQYATRNVFESKSMEALEIQARVVSRIALSNAGRVAHSWVTDDDYAQAGAEEAESENLVDLVRVVRDAEVAVLFRVRLGSVRVNLRSKSSFDVSRVARAFGGGGHVPAAGFTFDGNFDDVLPLLMPMLPGGARS